MSLVKRYAFHFLKMFYNPNYLVFPTYVLVSLITLLVQLINISSIELEEMYPTQISFMSMCET